MAIPGEGDGDLVAGQLACGESAAAVAEARLRTPGEDLDLADLSLLTF